jgi:PKD repeat protein
MKTFTRSFVLAALALSGVAGCTLDSPDPPMVTGPSTYFLSLTVTASPDVLPEDGSSQSVIRIIARDENGQPVRNLQLRVDTVDGGRIVDFGVLSARNVTTNSAGEATVVFTAPKAAIPGFDSGTVLEIRATPIGNDFSGANPRGVQIRLVPQSVATIPGAPTPVFSFSPSTPRPADLITFNASASSDDGTIVRYHWTFSDGHVEPDQAIVEHDFTSAGTYFVTLTVTDNENKSSSVTRAITVTAGS